MTEWETAAAVRGRGRARARVPVEALEAEIAAAYERIRNGIVRTPLAPAPALSRATGARVFVKWESLQRTGSFKLRGALNKVRRLGAAAREAGLVSASTGNHGLALCFAARREGAPLTLFIPAAASPEKIRRLRACGAGIELFPGTCEQAEIHARREAGRTGRIYVSPYNDIDVIAGQGTVGLEILEDLPETDDILVPIGGGGLAAGIAGWAKGRAPGVRVFGVEPAASAFMAAALAVGRLAPFAERPTIADAVAGGLEPGTVTLRLCRALLDGIVTVGEAGLGRAVAVLARLSGKPVEGAGALALAGLERRPAAFRGRRVVLVVSGGNIDPARLAEILRAHPSG